MKKIQALAAPKLHKPKLYPVALGYATLVTVATTGILFQSSEIVDVIVQYRIGGGRAGIVVAMLVAMAGVFALPYLLRMRVSPLMRVVGFVSSCVAPLGWLMGAWWLELYTKSVYSVWFMIGGYAALLLAVVSVWVIGMPMKPLKKRS